MLQACRDLDLATKAFDTDAGREIGREDFDDDAPSERALLGDEHATHPATAQLALDEVGAGEGSLEVVAKLGAHSGNVHPARGFGDGSR
jgi:hypothetical protein